MFAATDATRAGGESINCWILYMGEAYSAHVPLRGNGEQSLLLNDFISLQLIPSMARSLIVMRHTNKRSRESQMRNRIVNVVIIVAVVTLLSVLALYARVGATADSIAVIKTTGMTCGSCSSKITKALESLKGVAVTEVDVDGGWVLVGYDTKAVKPEVLAEKINAVGFGSNVHQVLTPDQFKQITGRDIGKKASTSGGCGGCGTKGGCGSNK
jgi:periplasmic mercuric ion binding protein